MMKKRIRRGTALYGCFLAAQLMFSACALPVYESARVDQTATGETREPPPEGTGEGQRAPGVLVIRIGGTGLIPSGGARTIFPELGTYTHYTLDFTHADGEIAPEMTIAEGEQVSVALKAGIWTLRATGFVDPQNGEAPFAAAWGAVSVEVEPGESIGADIVLDRIAADDPGEGFFSYGFEFPRDLVDSATLTLSVPGDDGAFNPYMTIDLRGEGKSEALLPLPPGYYRMEFEILSSYTRFAETELVHIYPRLETRNPRYRFTEADFPPYWEFADTEALKNHLAGLAENTQADPYPVKLYGIDLSSVEKTGNTLRTLCAALSRFVSLDLRDCRGDFIPSMSLTIAPNKRKVVSLILPETVTLIENNAFSGYSALVSIEMPGVTRIGKGAFKQDAELKSVSMPELRVIDSGDGSDSGAFRGCSLSEVYLPKAEIIGDYAFYNCEFLTAVSLPKALSVGKSAFRYNTELRSIELPLAESIGNYSLYNCLKLEDCTLGNIPPVLGGTQVFGKDLPLKGIFVPEDAMEAYAAAGDFWTPALKEKVKPLGVISPEA
ncbi:MAG: leucine-rich repeat domain-containing protein [Spirochaetaceae bacterium]|jgi:hypothetical protein|nr:leucine-rich repeat domain-containing protein [Spirochaetaceae bacterium]